MTNNDVLRGLRYALELDNPSLLALFREGGAELAPHELAGLLKNTDEDGFYPLDDVLLACLLDGLVIRHRGRRDGEVTPRAPVTELSNNAILRALRIALELKDGDLAAIMLIAGARVSKGELSALFRREDHRNYQPCGDQFLRNFLRGLGVWHRQGRPRAQ
ncbi:MAG: DUF1456 family protein [Polyangiales bacterium]